MHANVSQTTVSLIERGHLPDVDHRAVRRVVEALDENRRWVAPRAAVVDSTKFRLGHGRGRSGGRMWFSYEPRRHYRGELGARVQPSG